MKSARRATHAGEMELRIDSLVRGHSTTCTRPTSALRPPSCPRANPRDKQGVRVGSRETHVLACPSSGVKAAGPCHSVKASCSWPVSVECGCGWDVVVMRMGGSEGFSRPEQASFVGDGARHRWGTVRVTLPKVAHRLKRKRSENALPKTYQCIFLSQKSLAPH